MHNSYIVIHLNRQLQAASVGFNSQISTRGFTVLGGDAGCVWPVTLQCSFYNKRTLCEGRGEVGGKLGVVGGGST